MGVQSRRVRSPGTVGAAILVAAALALSACAAPTASPLQYAPSDLQKAEKPKINVAVGRVTLGYAPQNAHEGEMVRQALETTLASANLFASDAKDKLDIEIQTLRLDPDMVGVSFSSRAAGSYVVKTAQGKIIFQKTVNSVGNASGLEAFAGAERQAIAVRRSVAENFKMFTEDLARYLDTNGREVMLALAGGSKPAAAGRGASERPAARPPALVLGKAPAKTGQQADAVAVIIGNSGYAASGSGIPDLPPAAADADAVIDHMVTVRGLRAENMIVLKNATAADLARVFGSERDNRGELLDRVLPRQSRVFVYYAGQGAPGGEAGSPYLVPVDADAAHIGRKGFPLSVLYRNLGLLSAREVIVVLEASFSGTSQAGAVLPKASGIPVNPGRIDVPGNVTVITAAAEGQIASRESDSAHGLFTKYYLKGMAGEADAKPYGNGDGQVALSELQVYLRDTTTERARRHYGRDQTPQIIAGGRLVN